MKIKDQAGDKKYFTIVPNYILNHSTMWDREVYVQMKRITGEEGTCYASRATLAKQCGMSPRRLDKSIKYLIDHKWIALIGNREVVTRGGVQYVNDYEISDLWKMNVDYYENKKGIAHGATPTHEGMHTVLEGYSTDEGKGIAHGATKEEQRKEEPLNKREIVATQRTPKEESQGFFSEESNDEKESIILFLVTKNIPEKVARAEMGKFCSYWTERNQSGTKQRWEQEKTFEVKRRLATWFSKVNQFSRSGENKALTKTSFNE